MKKHFHIIISQIGIIKKIFGLFNLSFDCLSNQ